MIISKKKLESLLAERDRELLAQMEKMLNRNNAVLNDRIPAIYRAQGIDFTTNFKRYEKRGY